MAGMYRNGAGMAEIFRQRHIQYAADRFFHLERNGDIPACRENEVSEDVRDGDMVCVSEP